MNRQIFEQSNPPMPVADRNPSLESGSFDEKATLQLLYHAVAKNYLDLVLLCVKKLAHAIPQQNNYGPKTSLLWATQNGMIELVEFLLHHNANPNFKTDAGYTALDIAYDEGYLEIAKLLILYGAR